MGGLDGDSGAAGVCAVVWRGGDGRRDLETGLWGGGGGWICQGKMVKGGTDWFGAEMLHRLIRLRMHKTRGERIRMICGAGVPKARCPSGLGR